VCPSLTSGASPASSIGWISSWRFIHPLSAEGLKKKAIAISRFGSVFDVTAPELLGGSEEQAPRSHQSRKQAHDRRRR